MYVLYSRVHFYYLQIKDCVEENLCTEFLYIFDFLNTLQAFTFFIIIYFSCQFKRCKNICVPNILTIKNDLIIHILHFVHPLKQNQGQSSIFSTNASY